MKVVYEPPIMDRIRDAKATALREGRTIDHILLTEYEWNELIAWVFSFPLVMPDMEVPTDECQALGVKCRRDSD